jgi:hypothetical protein
MKFDESYMHVAWDVIKELGRYTGYDYVQSFIGLEDQSRLAVAIQRAVEHKQSGECKHDEPCKSESEQPANTYHATIFLT